MDKKAYTALKSKTFPLITFNMISVSEILLNNNKFSGNIKGNLFIAGKSNVISIHLNGILNNNKGNAEIDIKGETELKMSNFDMFPSCLYVGTLKTGDKIDVSFSLPFIRKSG